METAKKTTRKRRVVRKARVARRGAGRPRKAEGLEDVVARITELQRERDRAYAVLRKIGELVEGSH